MSQWENEGDFSIWNHEIDFMHPENLSEERV